MATQAVSNIAYALRTNETFVGEVMASRKYDPFMALFRQAKDVRAGGRGLVAYFNAVTRSRGGSGLIAENGDLPGGGAPATQQNSVTAELGALTIEYSEHELQAMREEPAQKNRQSVARDLKNEVVRERDRILGLFASRDDGVLARCAQAVSAATTVYSSIPIRLVEGDQVYSYPQNSSDGDERGLGGTEEIAAVRYVSDISFDTVDAVSGSYGSFQLSTADTLTDDAVIRRALHSTSVNVYGLEAHIDTVNDSNFSGWDSDDDATNDHVDTYAGLARSTYANLNVGTIYANSANLSQNFLTRAAQACIARNSGNIMPKMVMLMHPLMYDRYMVMQEGKTERSQVVLAPGASFDLPVLTFGGGVRVPVITSYLFNDASVIVLPRGTLFKVFAPVGWLRRDMIPQTAASGTGYSAKFTNSWRYFLNSYMNLPKNAVLIHGLATANT
jgi:hypothetical protein